MFNNFPTPANVKTQNFLQGVQVILTYQPNAEFMAHSNDTISFGNYNPTQLTEDELVWMDLWGWYEENNLWKIWR